MVFCDFHAHLSFFDEKHAVSFFSSDSQFYVCSCASTQEEFQLQNRIASHFPGNVIQSFGSHPFSPREEDVEMLEFLAQNKKIFCVGECGCDAFTPELRGNLEMQEKVFRMQLDIAVKYGLPVVIHNRKSLETIFRNSSVLSKCKCVVFHGFSFGLREAGEILRRIPNSCFSFGKNLLKKSPKSLECICSLPFSNIALETDAPFMTLKNESRTELSDIKLVYESCATATGIPMVEISEMLFCNFKKCFFSENNYKI